MAVKGVAFVMQGLFFAIYAANSGATKRRLNVFYGPTSETEDLTDSNFYDNILFPFFRSPEKTFIISLTFTVMLQNWLSKPT
eukprot:gene11519-11614_t